MAEEEPRTLLLLVRSESGLRLPEDPIEFEVKGKAYMLEVQEAEPYSPSNVIELVEGDKVLGVLVFHADAFYGKKKLWFVEYLHAKNMVNRPDGNEIPGGSEEAKKIRSDPKRPPIGTLLIKSLETLAPLNDIDAIELDVGWNSAPFYTGLGFTELRSGKGMRKVLTSPTSSPPYAGPTRRRRSRRNRRSKRKTRRS